MRRTLFTAWFSAALAHQAVAQPVTEPQPAGDHEMLAGDPPTPSPDEMAQAADATAAVATVPLAAPAAPAAPVAEPQTLTKASSDDIDLSALGLDPTAAAFDDKLNIYGFADFNYQLQHWTRATQFFPQDGRTFAYGNLNLYLAKNLTAKARTLAEVRFTFLPNGSMNPDGSIVEAAAADPVDFQRIAHWGGIVIERAYVEYDVTDHITVRGGHWLTPYGIWNIDHGSPAIVGQIRPYIIGEAFIPEHQTGIDVFGSHHIEGFTLGAHVTASNGRGATEAQIDQDSKLAFGGRLELATPWGLKIGSSYYRGRYTGVATTAGASAETYLEAAYGGDAQLDVGGLHIQAEALAHDRHYVAGQRARSAAGFTADGRDIGAYMLVGYRFNRVWNVMPFVIYEHYKHADHSLFTGSEAFSAGLNFRPAPSLVFKLETSYAKLNNDGIGLLAGEQTVYCNAQAAWVF